MSSWLPYAAIGIAGVVAFYVWKKLTTIPDPPKVSNIKKSCISIPNAGGFDRLCHTDSPFGVIGANIQGIKPGILDKHPSEYDNTLNKDLIMVEVQAFGINYADCCIRWGLYASAKEFVGWPITPGFEFSGKVTWIGDNTNTKFKIGDEVFGVSLFGSYTTHITVPSTQLFHKPSLFTMSEAAAFLCTALTSYYALFQLATPTDIPYITKAVEKHTVDFHNQNDDQKSDKEYELKVPGKYVLIHSASGGVGSMLCQLSKIANMKCIVGIVGGDHKVKMAKSMGCDIVINRKSSKLKNGNIWDEMKEVIPDFEGFDIIFDANGVATLKDSYKNLKPTGRIVVYGFHTMLPHTGSISPIQWVKLGINALRTPTFNPLHLVSENKGILGFNLSFLFKRTDVLEVSLANMIPWIQNKQFKVSKVTEYKMKDVGKAHKDIQSGNTVGKLVMITPYHKNYDNI